MYLDTFAERFVAAGFVTLVFDYRYQGASEGEPRGRIIPAEQHEDYHNAITWTSLRPEVDASRIGVWGSSYSGAHVLHLAAFDKRIKAAVSQVPLVNGMQNAQRLLRADVLAQFIETLAQDRVQLYTQGAVNYVPVVAPEGQPCALPTPIRMSGSPRQPRPGLPIGAIRSPWSPWRNSWSIIQPQTST
jgi:fermentation-respiration switch protein FrsA (DUF1100 family)